MTLNVARPVALHTEILQLSTICMFANVYTISMPSYATIYNASVALKYNLYIVAQNAYKLQLYTSNS